MNEITLKQARELVGLTQSEIDRRANLPQGTTHDLEAGRNKRPAWDVVIRISRVLQRAGLAGITTEQVFPVPDGEVRASS